MRGGGKEREKERRRGSERVRREEGEGKDRG